MFLVKNKKTSRILKNNKKQNSTEYVGPRGSHRAIVSRICFFVFGFLEVFATFSLKQKNFENTKKQNSTDYVGPRGSHWAIVSIFFGFWFLRGFCNFWSKTKNLEKIKNLKLHRLCGGQGVAIGP